MFGKSLAATALSACAIFGADFFPLEQGNYWRYQSSSGESFEIRVGAPVYANDQVYNYVRGYAPEPLLVRYNEYKNLVYFNEERRMDILLTSFEPFDRGWWEAPQRQCEQQGQTAEKRGIHSGPAGAIRDVLDVQYRSLTCADTGVVSEQYAENIGMVERTYTSIAGPRVFSLVEARVGKLSIDALPYGKFTVSLTDPPQGDLAVKLRLSTRPTSPLKLTFPSSQEFDVVLRDPDGSVVWSWSADKSFAQQQHQLSISGEWRTEVRIPRPTNASVYTIEAWLTTEGTPKFAAAIPATVAP